MNKSIILIIITTLGFYSCHQSTEDGPDGLYITGVSVIDVTDGHISKNMTLLLKGNVISKIGPINTFKIPKEAKVIEASGKYVIPGLWDMHAHTSSEPVTRQTIYPLFIANGVTGIRVMSADCFEPCWELQMNIHQSKNLQKDIIKGMQVGPRAILASTYIHGAAPDDSSTVQAPGNWEDGQKLVQLLKDRGVDFIKIYDELPREAYFGIAEEANQLKLPFAGHVPVSIKASEAAAAGQKSIEHCCEGSLFEECSAEEERLRKKITSLIQSGEATNMYIWVLELIKTYDEAKCQEVIKKLLKHNTYFTPTLLATEMDNILNTTDWRQDPRIEYLPKEELEFWESDAISTREMLGEQDPLIREKRFELVKKMNDSGVKLLAGSDCGVFGAHFGFGLHDELALLVEAGLSELEALQTATINAAVYAGKADSLGNTKAGMMGDLVILDANPLEDIRNTTQIFAVITDGRYYDRKHLDAILEKVLIAGNK